MKYKKNRNKKTITQIITYLNQIKKTQQNKTLTNKQNSSTGTIVIWEVLQLSFEAINNNIFEIKAEINH